MFNEQTNVYNLEEIHMFYQKGIDITNDKQMFNFLKSHTTYYTMNSWNGVESIANDVKLYRLNLSGDWATAYDLLANGEYDTINCMVQIWADLHNGFEVNFNGRSGGYLVLCNNDNNGHVLPESVLDNDTYEDYKAWCRDEYGSVKANRTELVFYTKLVQDFDKLCDELRDFCNELSQQTFEIVEMRKAVDEFNEVYANDLEYLEFQYLKCDEQGIVDISEILCLQSLTEAFLRTAKRADYGYGFEWLEDNRICLKKK
jgi:hypothetical protein